jgi:uncharacterized protein
MTTDAPANRPADESADDNRILHADVAETPNDGAPSLLADTATPLPIATTTTTTATDSALEAAWLARFDAAVPRSTVAETWDWAWKDTAMRVLPFAAGAGVYAWLSRRGLEGIGITHEGWRREVLLGVAVGAPLAGLAAVFRERVSPSFRLPTTADQLAQTLFYFAVNAPGEELFWRGTVQDMAVRVLARLPRTRRWAGLLGWAATTAVFGAYHRLGKWSWRSIAGVTFAGALFGALYQWPVGRHGKRSILAPTIAHGFATAGFLSWADFYMYLRQRRRYLTQMRTSNTG